jgi:hypothetical protein
VVIRIGRPWKPSPFEGPVCCLLLLGLFLAAIAAWNSHTRKLPRATATVAVVPSLQPGPEPRLPRRLVYPYSVVPGGVAGAGEAAAAARLDPVVEAHYAGFQLDRASMTDNPQVRFVHVSYRKGDRILWTRNKVRLPAGERLLSDGRFEIRARCGNRIASVPQGDVEPEPDAPSAESLVTPILDEEPIEETQPGMPLPVPSTIAASLHFPVEPELRVTGLNPSPQTLPLAWTRWTQPEPWTAGYILVKPSQVWPLPPSYVIAVDSYEVSTEEFRPKPADEEERASEVPEPSALALTATGLTALLFLFKPRTSATPASAPSETAPSTNPCQG